MLGRRGKDTEHSAMRKLKNEFMASWDGLRTRERERVLVLAATNRPFDLDDAVIRRFPRRSLLFISRPFFRLLSMESLEFQSKP
jgi:SpoVK/Ycf46/Vps4 family AAA+-type ATPase